ncbi:MAG TPA: TIGR03118 family protein, partial [Pirellulales bacterium]|nr:TIGR03118 family protein [Pirellulales bacterium]
MAEAPLTAMGSKTTATTTAQAGYLQLNIIADRIEFGLLQNLDLVNDWGISVGPSGPFWIANNDGDLATLLSGDTRGTPLVASSQMVSIPDGSPSGQVFNGTGDFVIGTGADSAPATRIFASENGALDAWNAQLSPTSQALSVVKTPGAVYKGLTIGVNAGANFLYAADFHDDRIYVFDKNFQPVTLAAGAFTDPNIPAGFAPFGIQALGGKLYVTYAQQNSLQHDDVAGPGDGFVDVFDTAGKLLDRLIVGSPGNSSSPLNSPWGVTMAPPAFGDFGGDLLVGNFGDGKINAFDPNTGAFLGSLSDPSGNAIVLPGLWSLTFGNGNGAGDVNTLYFTSAPTQELDGLFGSLQSALNTPLAGVGSTFSVKEGESFNFTDTEGGNTIDGSIATINDVATGARPADFTALIDWGDGHTSAGT